MRGRASVLSALLAGCCLAGPLLIASRSLAVSSSAVQVFVQPGAHATPILSLIRQARHSIRLEIYLLTDRTIIKELGRATQRGLDVRVLLEERPYGGDRSARLGSAALRLAGVPVRWANEGTFRFTHEKAMEIDGHVAGIFTSNLTSSGIFRNREFGVIDPNSTDASALATIFDGDWNRRRPHLSDPRLVVSPYNSRSALTTLIDRARRSLDLYAEEIDDASIESHLASAVRRQVRVRLITSKSSPGVDALRHAGVSVRLMAHPYVHAKAIVADGSGVFIGSENLSSTSLDQNREVGILLRDANAAAVVERTFAIDWGGSPIRTGPPPSPSRGLHVRVTAHPRSVTRGRLLTITASTTAGAACRIRVTYPDGYVSRARALSTVETADASGTVSWSWHVGTRVLGTARASVTCTLGSASATGSTTFQVR